MIILIASRIPPGLLSAAGPGALIYMDMDIDMDMDMDKGMDIDLGKGMGTDMMSHVHGR